MPEKSSLPVIPEKSGRLSITFECPESLAKAIEDEAKARLTSVSSILRMAVESMLRPRLLKCNKDDIEASQSFDVQGGD